MPPGKLIFLHTDINQIDGMTTFDLALLRNFAVIARTGSISVAGLQVGRTQSALSMQMRRLEEQVGQKLLHRSGSGVRLTTAGERLLRHAEALLGRHDEIVADMSGTGLRGTVSFGCPEDYSIAFLPELLRGFCADQPEVQLQMVCAPSSELRPMLHRRQIEVALVSIPDGSSAEAVRREDFVWVGNEAEPASGTIAWFTIAGPASLPTQTKSSRRTDSALLPSGMETSATSICRRCSIGRNSDEGAHTI